MKISALEVDGYGVWSGLKLDELSDGLNVFFGPNEAGKTTLMQFIRSVLYGFSPPRRRYLPPLGGGRPGGSVLLDGPNGRFQVSRYDNEQEPGGPDVVTISGADGTRQGEHLLKVLLCNVDGGIFNNVFTVGLRELQELGSLDDTEAASMLYSLSVGVDSVPLVEVMESLEGSRNHVLHPDGRPCEVTRLLDRRQKLRGEIEELDTLTRSYARLAGERDQLQRETTRLDEENHRNQHQARVIEIAMAVRQRWQTRAALDEQLHAVGPADAMPEGALARLDGLDERIKHRQGQVDQLKHRWQQLRQEAKGLKINEALWRLSPRIEALLEQEDWIGTLQSRIAELEAEIAELEGRLSAEHQQLGLDNHNPATGLPSLSARSLQALRQPAKALRQSRLVVEEARQEVAAARETVESLTGRIEAALAVRGEQNLTDAVDRTGNLVAQFRRRTQIDQRVDQMQSYQVELEEQSRRLLDRQILPVWAVVGLGAVFVVGAVMIGMTLFGSLGWLLAMLGIGGVCGSVAAKFLFERSNARKLEACQKQIGMLQVQIEQAKQERDHLDGQLPHGEGSIAGRLKAAETQLAALEELVPLDAQRQAAQQEADAAAQQTAEAEAGLAAVRRRWEQALAAIGLPTNLSPKQVRNLAGRCDQLGELKRRLELRYEEFHQRTRELDALSRRIAKLATDAGLSIEGDHPVDQLRALALELSEQERDLKRREVLRSQVRQLRRKLARYEEAVSRLKHRRRDLFHSAGTADEHDFRRRAARFAQAESLRSQRLAIQREIDAAIAGHCPEDAVGEELEAQSGGTLEARLEQLQKQSKNTEAKLQERFEKRGRLSEQLKTLADDRAPALKQLELSVVEKRLEEAVHRWRVRAVACRMLDRIRTTYERDRQPETLQEASGYLERLTQGRYVRVWTPLGQNVLRVDDAEGKSLPVEVLSRGTREQLFVCLRLALASSFARRGALLPLVLDDVLVNLDADRARATAAVLRDFAAAGHQILVFTCHEHILKLFKALRVQVNRLPGNVDHDGLQTAFQSTTSQSTTKKRRKRKTKPRELPAERLQPAASGRLDDEDLQAEDAAAEERLDADEEQVSWEDEEVTEPEDLPVQEDELEEEEEEVDSEAELDERDDQHEDDYDEEDEYDNEDEFDEEGLNDAEAA